MDFYKQLESERPEPETDFVYDVLTINLFMIESGDYYFWDPLAAAILTDEKLATLRNLLFASTPTKVLPVAQPKSNPVAPSLVW